MSKTVILANSADLIPPRILPENGDRHSEHLVGYEHVPHTPAGSCRGGEARSLGIRWLSSRTPCNFAGRDHGQAHSNVVSQSALHGDRRTTSQPSDRWRRAAGRLRQNNTWPDHGRNQHGYTGGICAGRIHVARPLAGENGSAVALMAGNMALNFAPAISRSSNGPKSKQAVHGQPEPATPWALGRR